MRNFLGELICPDVKESDQGAYSCEAINTQGICFAGQVDCGQPGKILFWKLANWFEKLDFFPNKTGQDAIVIIDRHSAVCPKGSFNAAAKSPDECLPCFCFGITNECSSTELNVEQVPNSKIISQYIFMLVREFFTLQVMIMTGLTGQNVNLDDRNWMLINPSDEEIRRG